jgi:hypothetical protein
LSISSPTRTGIVPLQAAAQVRRNKKADLNFSSRRTREGSVELEGRGGDLAFRKTVNPNGSFTVDLQSSRDKVSIEFTGVAVTVVRGKSRLTLGDMNTTEEDVTKVQRLLADSPAIKLSRIAAAAVMDSEDDSPDSAAVLLTDALVGTLSGDPGAPGRVAKHLSRHVQKGVRKAAIDCYSEFERGVWDAWVDYVDCLNAIDLWNPMQYWCGARYIAMAETRWFGLIGCIGGAFF